MHVHYQKRSNKLEGNYRCEQYARNQGQPPCQRVSGSVIDKAVSELLLQSFTPLTVELAFQIQDELKQRYESLDRMRRQHLERLEYEANMAKRRYMQVDPDNRLVADTLEAEWNNKLRALKEAHVCALWKEADCIEGYTEATLYFLAIPQHSEEQANRALW